MANKEVHEAIAAGERALETLKRAKASLDSAEGWGLFDLLAGGLLVTAVKRSHMDEAKAHIESFQRDLRAFQRELRDVELICDVELEDSGMLAFADYMFDSFLSDLLVQRQIEKAQAQMTEIERQVSSVIRMLKTTCATS